MSNKKYKVQLSENERTQLEELLQKGTQKARTLNRARVLLWSASKTDEEIASLLLVSKATVQNIRQRYCQRGIEQALYDRPRPGKPPKIKGLEKAEVTALACSNPPEGKSRWSLRLLANRAVELELIPEISPQSVQRLLKKTNLSLTSNKVGVSES